MRKHYETIQLRGTMQITPIKNQTKNKLQTSCNLNLLTIIMYNYALTLLHYRMDWANAII